MEEVAIIADFEGKGFDFAKGVYNYLKSKENREFSVSLINVQRAVFRDGEVKLKIADNVRNKKCFLIHDSNKHPFEWFTELVFELEAMGFSSPKEVNIVLPYTRFARQDRKDESRVSVNAKALADVVSLYADRGMTVDLHTPQIQEYFQIPYDNLYSLTSLLNHLQKKHPDFLKDIVIVSPDLGGGKRAEYFVKRLHERGITADVAFGHKTREKDNEVAKNVIIGEVEGKNCLVIDDIIDTGNTMAKTAEKLREKGANKIFAYGTHGLFTEGLEKFKVFDRIFVSDTLQTPRADNIEIVSLINLFGEAIFRTATGQSLSDLFDSSKADFLEKYKI
jgi:ribose-phosphate pyrophosphokinase